MTFNNYVERQLAYRDYRRVPQHMRALEQGRYVRYLRPYFEIFGANNICVVFFEDLLSDPVRALEEVCLFSGIDPRFFDGFEFRVHNPTRTIRSARLDRLHERARAAARTLARNQFMLQAVKDTLWRSLEPLYLRLNVAQPSRVDISAIRQTLQDYYRDDITALEQLVGKPLPPPWYSALMKSKNIEEDVKATT